MRWLAWLTVLVVLMLALVAGLSVWVWRRALCNPLLVDSLQVD